MNPENIKYKAFVKDANRVYPVIALIFDEKDNKVTKVVFREFDVFDPVYNIEDVVLLPFTGFCDNKGTEIYEGDVLKEGSFNYIVGECKNHIYVEEYEYDGTTPKTYYYVQDWGIHQFAERFQDCKIVGNVYENPELLEE